MEYLKEFKDKVAVITGAGNGFGAEFAKEAAKRGMKLLLVDIDKADVERTLEEVKKMGAQAICEVLDVSLEENVKKMLKVAIDNFSRVDLLINNAGVVSWGTLWDLPSQDFEWIMGINVMAQMYSLKHFIPVMTKQDTPCNILNVASMAGLNSGPTMPVYHASKYASVGLSESVSLNLEMKQSKIKISVFCPAFIKTDLHNCDRHRPERFKINDDAYYGSEINKYDLEKIKFYITTGLDIDNVGQTVFDGISDDKFYITMKETDMGPFKRRASTILEGKNPDKYYFMPKEE